MSHALALDRVALNVSDLDALTAFYCEALGFSPAEIQAGPSLTHLPGLRATRVRRLRRGSQMLELCHCDPPGAPMPEHSRSNDTWFQHCALVTADMAGAYARLCRSAFTPISRDGPQLLPGGIVAFKFRDLDGHPLELISFPQPDPITQGGIDHSAICVTDAARSIAFYTSLGLSERARQVNRGPAQDALDDLDAAVADVIALAPEAASPHVELLAYHHPRGRTEDVRPNDIAASRLVFACAGPHAAPQLLKDPDGHLLQLEHDGARQP